MLAFDTVKRIGNGNYLNEDSFIIERIRKARALRPQDPNINAKSKIKAFFKDEKPNHS